MNHLYTGFTTCKTAETHQRTIKTMKISRFNMVKQSAEPIVRPKSYLCRMEDIRKKLVLNVEI